MNITKSYFVELQFFTYTNQFFFKYMSKKNFFSSFFDFSFVEYCRFRHLFFQKVCTSNFCCNQLWLSYDVFLESS